MVRFLLICGQLTHSLEAEEIFLASKSQCLSNDMQFSSIVFHNPGLILTNVIPTHIIYLLPVI